MTEKMYFSNPHCREFEARVISCAKREPLYEVITHQSCFFPAGGGQPADTGALGEAAVLDVCEKDGEVIHLCDRALEPGRIVRGRLDWEQRFARMQCHTGEHILSGLAHQLYGCENVGFHMSPDSVTIDFDAELSPVQLERLEGRANETVWANLPVLTRTPCPEELETLPFRSKRALAWPVRLVEIGGIDLCACCAPHVTRTGEIGIIRVTDSMRHRRGTRLTMRAGRFAYETSVEESKSVAEIAKLFSANRDTVVAAAEHIRQELEDKKREIAQLKRARTAARVSALPFTQGNLCFFEEETDLDTLRELVNAGMGKCGGVCAAFSGGDQDGYRYIIGSLRVDLQEKSQEINAAIGGRGGGGKEMLRGSASAPRQVIEAYFSG